MTKPPFLITSTGVISIYLNGSAYSVDTTHSNYDAIKQALKDGEYDGLVDLVNVAASIKRNFAANTTSKDSGVEILNGEVIWNGQPIHSTLTERILQFIKEGFDFKPLVNFLNKLMLNPSKKSLDNLYRFLDVNQHPITEDGCFLCYKRVNDDYMDMHQSKYSNKPGTVVSMPRNQVEDDPNITCAPGLHVASLKYAMYDYNSGIGRLVVCKIDPQDVVSVPTDYNNAKMRVCKYEVLQDFVQEIKQEEVVIKAPVFDAAHAATDPDDDYLDDDDDEMDEEFDGDEDE